MRGKWTFPVLGAVIVILACGCGRNTRTIDTAGGAPREVSWSPGLVAMSSPYVPDIPVPLDFKQIEKKSINFGTGTARYVHHVYKGKANKWEVRRFYEKQMPINRWSLVTYMSAEGEIRLDYEKQNERCRITIGDGSWFHRTRILARVWTSAPTMTQQQLAKKKP